MEEHELVAAELAGVTLSEAEANQQELNLRIAAYRTTSLMGPSGAGKTIILKMLAGLLAPAAGTVRIMGESLSSLSDRQELQLRRRVGYVFQDAALWQNADVFQNIALPLRYHRVYEDERELESNVTALAKRFEIGQYLTRRPANVPFGVRKTVSFVRALATNPEILFVDEPTAFLDAAAAERIFSAMRRLKSQRKTVVTATSDPRITAKLADDLVVLKDMRILEAGAVMDIARSRDPAVTEILSDVLSEAATYAGDILELMDPDVDPFP